MHPAEPDQDSPCSARLKPDTTGLILAGGAGRRVRGRDKGLIHWQGQPLAAYAAATLRPLVGELLVSCNRHHTRYRDFADRVISDRRPGYQGPLAGLEAAAARVSTALLLVTPCDMPTLPRDTYRRLLERLVATGDDKTDAVFLQGGGRDHYLCMSLRREAMTGLGDYLDGGGRSVHGWLATLRAKGLPVDLPAAALRNINRVADAD